MNQGRPRLYTDRQRFIIAVLWLKGYSDSQVAGAMHAFGVPMTRKAVSRQVPRQFRGRDKMPVSVRQRFLDRLKADRLDGGILPDEMFTVAT